MKKKVALIFIAIASAGSFGFVLVKKAGKAGYTGAPGESACNNCHNSYALNSGPGSISFGSDIPGDSYTPGTTYHLTLTVRQAGIGLFGFGIEALKTGNTDAGLFVVTNSTRMQILTAANGRKNMVHKLNGGAFPDSSVFTFDWQAPSTNVGPITFYYSGVCGNANNSDNLDYVYKGSHTITSTSTVGIESPQTPYADLTVKPFPLGQMVNVEFNLEEVADIDLSLITLDGKTICTYSYADQAPGYKSYSIMTAQLNTGVYVLHAKINGASVTRKFLLNQ